MGGDIAPYFASNEAGVYDQLERFRAPLPPTAPTGAMWVLSSSSWSMRAHGLIAQVPSSTCTTRIGRFTRCPATCRRPPVHAGRDRRATPPTSDRLPVIVSGGEVHHSVLSPTCTFIPGPRLLTPCCSSRRGHQPSCPRIQGDSRQERGAHRELHRRHRYEHDLARGFTVTPDGITVVPKNTIVDD